jgi:luciferase family oxidoreductase group 1
MTSDHHQFPSDVLELMGYYKGENGSVWAIPGEGLRIPITILGSSLFGAELAAALGLPFAFFSHFAPQMMMEAIDLYRQRFEPSEQLERPYVILGCNAFIAETDEKAQVLATSVQQAFVALRSGRPIPSPPRPGYLEELPLQTQALLRSILSCSVIGSPEPSRQKIDAFVATTGADEITVTSHIYDHQARLRSFALLAEAFEPRAAAQAS